jgi:hypothetical protein
MLGRFYDAKRDAFIAFDSTAAALEMSSQAFSSDDENGFVNDFAESLGLDANELLDLLDVGPEQRVGLMI